MRLGRTAMKQRTAPIAPETVRRRGYVRGRRDLRALSREESLQRVRAVLIFDDPHDEHRTAVLDRKDRNLLRPRRERSRGPITIDDELLLRDAIHALHVDRLVRL